MPGIMASIWGLGAFRVVYTLTHTRLFQCHSRLGDRVPLRVCKTTRAIVRTCSCGLDKTNRLFAGQRGGEGVDRRRVHARNASAAGGR